MKILLLEDDATLSSELSKFLENRGYGVVQVYDGEAFLKEIRRDSFGLYLLDINVPKVNGLEVCAKIRETDADTPILIISAFGDISDKKEAFGRQADDYLVKPFAFEELMMRIEALGRRQQRAEDAAEIIRVENLSIDKVQKKVWRDGQEIPLTVKEYQLLVLLAESPGQIFSKQQISEAVWDINFNTNTNTIEVYINFLRKKIDKEFEPKLIHTRPGFGYYIQGEQ